MNNLDSIEKLIQKDKYQVFLFTCRATVPFNFARHSWFVVNKKGVLSRWEICWKADELKTNWGHLYKDFYPLLQGIEMFFFSKKYFFKANLLSFIEGGPDSVAHQMTEFIEASPKTYPHCYKYSLKGPNSNTYTQWVLNNFPESKMRLSWNSVGNNKV